MDAKLRRESQLLILHQLLEPTGLLGVQRVACSQVGMGSEVGGGVVTEQYPAAPRPHLEPLGQQDLMPGLSDWVDLPVIPKRWAIWKALKTGPLPFYSLVADALPAAFPSQIGKALRTESVGEQQLIFPAILARPRPCTSQVFFPWFKSCSHSSDHGLPRELGVETQI